ncbi:MAG: hypothetical protein ACI392_06045 [Paludibacteraceae bacterium]
MTNIEKTKLIDKYLSNELSEEERTDFERLLFGQDLSSNGKLSFREEMQLQKNIETAIRERGLRDMLRKEESHIRQKQRIKRIVLWSLGGSGLLTAIAAALCLLLVIAPMAQMMQNYSTTYVSQVSVGASRGNNEYATMLNEALVLMQNDKWDDASNKIDEVLQQTMDCRDKQTLEIRETAEWLEAVYLMHEGKVIKAKRLLQKIANSDSYYSVQASEWLEKL